ncbi:hypothetical protein E4U53_004065 [Claviceps sorghi]|nr:hypothetical protein E4U53_004065 [Claviceps sorghi]
MVILKSPNEESDSSAFPDQFEDEGHKMRECLHGCTIVVASAQLMELLMSPHTAGTNGAGHSSRVAGGNL